MRGPRRRRRRSVECGRARGPEHARPRVEGALVWLLPGGLAEPRGQRASALRTPDQIIDQSRSDRAETRLATRSISLPLFLHDVAMVAHIFRRIEVKALPEVTSPAKGTSPAASLEGPGRSLEGPLERRSKAPQRRPKAPGASLEGPPFVAQRPLARRPKAPMCPSKAPDRRPKAPACPAPSRSRARGGVERHVTASGACIG